MGAITLQRVMLADDEPDIVEISRIALETVGGYEVAVCGSGSELLRQAPEFKPDLIIVDVLMPDLGGHEVFEQLRSMPQFAETPIVFLTGLIHEDELDVLQSYGAADIILKPFDPMTLADRVAGIWESLNDR